VEVSGKGFFLPQSGDTVEPWRVTDVTEQTGSEDIQ